MPFAYSIEAAHRVTICRVWGLTTLELIASLRSAIRLDPLFDPTFDFLLDLRDSDQSGISTADLQAIAVTRSKLDATSRRAIVTRLPVQFGIARMFETHREMAGQDGRMRVCRSLEEALTWLGLEDFAPALLADSPANHGDTAVEDHITIRSSR